MEASLVSKMWSVRIQGMDISMGNWILRPIVSSRKNSLNQSWERSQHCCKVSAQKRYRFYYRDFFVAIQRALTCRLLFLLTTEVQQVGVKERLAVKLLNVQDGGTFQTAAQSLLGATFVSNKGLQHSPHHVKLHTYIREISLLYFIITGNLISLIWVACIKGLVSVSQKIILLQTT